MSDKMWMSTGTLIAVCGLALATFTLVYAGSEMFKLRNRVNDIENVLWEEVDE